jgi:hypothetical protein
MAHARRFEQALATSALAPKPNVSLHRDEPTRWSGHATRRSLGNLDRASYVNCGARGNVEASDVSYIAQIPDRQRRMRITIDTPSQSVRPLIQAESEPIRVSVAFVPKHVGRKGNTMQVPSILQGEPLKGPLQGAAAGPVATMIVGFSSGGGSLGSTADKTAKEWSELVFFSLAAAIVLSVGMLLLSTLHP